MDTKKTKNSFVGHYFCNGLLKNSQITIVCLILHLISFPVTLGIYTVGEYFGEHKKFSTVNDVAEVFFVLSVIFTALAVLAGVMIAMGSFSYLHKKHEADMYLSLPLSDRQRFWCDYLSGLVSYVVPVIIAQVVTFCVSLVTMHFLPEMKSFGTSGYDLSLGKVVLELYALAIVVMIMLYTFTVLACVLCGNIFEALLSTVLINGAIPGLLLLLTYISFNKVWSLEWVNSVIPILSKTSPFGAVFSFVYYADLYGDEAFRTGFMLKFMLWILIFTLIFAALSYVLYKSRKAESVSKPYVFKGYYYALISSITFAICSIIPMSFETLIVPIIVVAVVAYMIFKVIANRGFKNVKSSLLRSLATIGFSLLIIEALNTPWGFGIPQRVPDADKI